ncbi:unnamed protein product [Prorocentrum cordatum]|uniref:Uncharacterized protein n=1 Tax=Prorocentrum cordatum TaxID=2364126 RepID=A0ABN9PQQ5_9DINO|nr:unnamed protein product [Polarella glacialis]
MGAARPKAPRGEEEEEEEEEEQEEEEEAGSRNLQGRASVVAPGCPRPAGARAAGWRTSWILDPHEGGGGCRRGGADRRRPLLPRLRRPVPQLRLRGRAVRAPAGREDEAVHVVQRGPLHGRALEVLELLLLPVGPPLERGRLDAVVPDGLELQGVLAVALGEGRQAEHLPTFLNMAFVRFMWNSFVMTTKVLAVKTSVCVARRKYALPMVSRLRSSAMISEEFTPSLLKKSRESWDSSPFDLLPRGSRGLYLMPSHIVTR